ncbi:MAG: hypothetical protein M1814_004812 [Vezdaea aestivalis]|nr:MAG: hypothetical protein M1814_004812 [Vezdaea aestivalis]
MLPLYARLLRLSSTHKSWTRATRPLDSISQHTFRATVISGGALCLFGQTRCIKLDSFNIAQDKRQSLRPKKKTTEKDEEISMFEDDDSSAWSSFSDKFASVGSSISSVQWSTISDKISDFIIPDWVRPLPGYITKLQLEISMAPGSVAEQVWDEAADPYIHPEIRQHASVRISSELCNDEKAFIAKRKLHTAAALARYLGLKESEIHPDDVPTIAMCGSGGGLRALVAGTSSYLSTAEAGLFDCVAYTAGVSGSCWLQSLYYSSITGQSHAKLVEHLKARIGVHIAFPPKALSLLSSAPTNKYLLSGLVEKLKGDPDGDFGLVDIYGLLLAARLLVPKGELTIEDSDTKLSHQRKYIADGENPMPIYTSVRHEIPLEEAASQSTPKGSNSEIKEIAKQEAWFQWFESTPYELWCEELQAGIPSWAVGRSFDKGHSTHNLRGTYNPEHRLPLLMGIWGSAFCATLAHYYKEIRPVVQGLTGLGGLDSLVSERTEDLGKVHPIDPASIPNFALGLREQLPKTCPESIFKASHLRLMDAGMSNNLPIYPFLRPGRAVDIIVAFDASADVKRENWLGHVDGYARQRGIKGWPVEAGWPKKGTDAKDSATQLAEKQEETRSTETAAAQVAMEREEKRGEGDKGELGYCSVWVGSTAERMSESEPPPPKPVANGEVQTLEIKDGKDGWEPLPPEAGIAVVYFPLLPNEDKVPGVKPDETEFLSTWNFIYSPEEIEKVVSLARANFEEGKERTKRVVRAVYERKKGERLQREEDLRIKKERKARWREGDQFS